MQEQVKSTRNAGFDILKAFCAFFVVCIHSPFPGAAGKYFDVLTRVAVPIFFMISGFFYHNTAKNKKEMKQIKKILKLFLISNLIYFFWQCFFHFARGYDVLEYIINTLNIKSIIEFCY